MNQHALPERLRILRENSGLTQMAVARAIGVPRVTYTHYELGKRSPDLDTLLLIAAFFRVSTDFLLGTTWLRPTLEQWLAHQAAGGEAGDAEGWPYPMPEDHPGMKIADT